jgi:hypothetical protein
MSCDRDQHSTPPVLSKVSGMEFFARRVFQRWSRGEISTDKAVQLLRPVDAQRPSKLRAPGARRQRLEATFEIDPASVADDATVGIVGLRLVHMGGSFVFWKPDDHQRPAVARFEFETAAARDRFVAEAVQIPGVSESTLQ